MMRLNRSLGAGVLFALPASAAAAPAAHPTHWLRDAKLDAVMHFWPNASNEMALVDAFDVPAAQAAGFRAIRQALSPSEGP